MAAHLCEITGTALQDKRKACSEQSCVHAAGIAEDAKQNSMRSSYMDSEDEEQGIPSGQVSSQPIHHAFGISILPQVQTSYMLPPECPSCMHSLRHLPTHGSSLRYPGAKQQMPCMVAYSLCCDILSPPVLSCGVQHIPQT